MMPESGRYQYPGRYNAPPQRAPRRRGGCLQVGALILCIVVVLSGAFLYINRNGLGLSRSGQEAYSNRGYNLAGPPTLPPHFIDLVLDRYDSPAAGKGQALYDYGIKYGIDPTYALAFFLQESSFGKQGVATVTHSLGNIRAIAGFPSYQGYRKYATWEEGFEDWFRLISHHYVGERGLHTVDEIIPIYAPGRDNNDEAAYINTVKHAVNNWHTGIIEV